MSRQSHIQNGRTVAVQSQFTRYFQNKPAPPDRVAENCKFITETGIINGADLENMIQFSL